MSKATYKHLGWWTKNEPFTMLDGKVVPFSSLPSAEQERIYALISEGYIDGEIVLEAENNG